MPRHCVTTIRAALESTWTFSLTSRWAGQSDLHWQLLQARSLPSEGSRWFQEPYCGYCYLNILKSTPKKKSSLLLHSNIKNLNIYCFLHRISEFNLISVIIHITPVSLFCGYTKYVMHYKIPVDLHVISTLHHTSVPQPYLLLLLIFLPPPSLAFIPSAGCPGGRPHHQLPAGEVPCGPPEPWGEELPHFLSADRGRGGGPAETPGPREEPSAVPVPGQSQCLVL